MRFVQNVQNVLAVFVLLAPLRAPAQAPGEPDLDLGKENPADSVDNDVDVAAAKKALGRYLDAVVAKKWDEAKKLIHPATLELLAQQKKRLHREAHELAAWARAGEVRLTKWKIASARRSELGPVVVATREDHFHVEEKGTSEDDAAAYLVVKKNGLWLVADRKADLDDITDDAIKIGYPGLLEPQAEKAAEPPPAKEAPAVPWKKP